jgi:DNA-binding MarR family transcriptional regulator
MTQSTGYAITALGHVAAMGDQPLLIKDIAEATGLPHPYLAKIIHTLARRGLVVTRRGVGGGVTLARSAARSRSTTSPRRSTTRCWTSAACSAPPSAATSARAPRTSSGASTGKAQIDFLRDRTLADVAAFELRQLERSAA